MEIQGRSCGRGIRGGQDIGERHIRVHVVFFDICESVLLTQCVWQCLHFLFGTKTRFPIKRFGQLTQMQLESRVLLSKDRLYCITVLLNMADKPHKEETHFAYRPDGCLLDSQRLPDLLPTIAAHVPNRSPGARAKELSRLFAGSGPNLSNTKPLCN